MASASFAELTGVHEWLDELFIAHQVALLSLDLDDERVALLAQCASLAASRTARA